MTTDLRFVGDWKLWSSLVVAFVLAALAWLLYRREAKQRTDYLRWLLPFLRSAAVFWLVLMLAGPVLHHRTIIGELARIFLLVDGSQSMKVTDEQMDPVRKLMFARQMGWLPEDRLDMEIRHALDSFTRAEQLLRSARGDMKPEELSALAKNVDKELQDAAKALSKMRPETWKIPNAVAGQMNAELFQPAQKLAEQEVGKDTDRYADNLLKLADVALSWRDNTTRAASQYANKLVETNDPVIQDAIKRYDSMPRWKRMEAMLLEGKSGLLGRMAAEHDVELLALNGAKTEVLWWPGAKEAEQKGKPLESLSFAPQGNSTDLADGPKNLVEDVKTNERVAVVLLSDGQHNSGPSPVQTAKLLGNRAIPIFAVGIGSDKHPPDIAILDVKGPDTVYQEANVKGTIELKDDMPPGKSFVVKIEMDGKVVWQKSLLTEQRPQRTVAFDFPIKDLVKSELAKKDKDLKFNSLPFSMKVSVSVLPEERNAENNTGVLRFSAITERPKVMIIDGRPRWEFRYLRNLFERDQKWEVNSLLLGAGGEYRPFTRGNKPEQFPTDIETLFSYQLICIGDIPPNAFTAREQDWLKQFVEQRGGGIIFIDGPREQLSHFLNTPLKPLFPVEWHGSALESATLKFRFAAKGSLQAPVSLVGDADANNDIWSNLRTPHWVASVQPLPGAETLLEVLSNGKPYPAMVFQHFGAGRILYSAFEESWRWRYEVGDQYHQRFWNQVSKYIMEAPFPVQDKYVSLDSGTTTYAPGDSAEIRVRLRDAQGRLRLSGKADAIISRDGKKVATVALSSDDNGSGVLRGRTAALEEGTYDVKVMSPDAPESEMKAQTSFVVKPEGAGEMALLHCNEDLLRDMAFHSGGAYFREDETSELFDRLKPLSQGKVVESETVLWQSWWWFLPVVVLLTLEWALRKRAGML